MKFFHISDLHIGLRLLDRDLSDDQRYVLAQIAEHAKAEQPDAIVIAGDIYNKAAPSPEAVALYDWFIDELVAAAPGAAIMVIAGNHDDALRIDMYGDVLDAQHIHLAGTPPKAPGDHIKKVVLSDRHGDVVFWLLPFLTPARVHAVLGEGEAVVSANADAVVSSSDGDKALSAGAGFPGESRSRGEGAQCAKPRLTYDDAIRALIAREDMDPGLRNVIVSHQFYVESGVDPEDVEQMDSENLRVGGLGAVRADILQAFDYAALGHLHKPMLLGSERIRYCGTPMQYSVSEAGQEKGIVIVEMGAKGDVSTRVMPLSPLHRIIKVNGDLEEVLDQACDDYAAVTVEHAWDIPTSEIRDRIKSSFPNLLSYSRISHDAVIADLKESEQVDSSTPFDMCLRFLGDATEEQKGMLLEIIDEAIGAGNETD